MSGTRPSSPSPAEHHLGDRLAALVDGELGHDARERVLAHLATCARCKAEADAQRTLKSVFASSAPPAPSEGFLARLQGLPGGPPGDPGAPRGPLEELLHTSGVRTDGFATAVVTPHPGHGPGFRIHDVGDRGSGTPGRGRRFAFAAAGAVSFAAIALGGTLPLEASVNASGRGGQGTGNAVAPLRASASATGGTNTNASTSTSTGTSTGTSASTGAGTGTGTSVSTGATAGTVRGNRFGERSTGAQAIDAEPLRVPPVPSVPSTVPSVPSVPAPLVAVRLQNPNAQSLFALSPFIRPTGPVLQLPLAAGPGPAPGSTTLPLGSPR